MSAPVSAPMRAVVLPAAGAPLQLCQRPVPTLCQPHQVRVRVKAASVNPVDLKLAQRGAYRQPEGPAVLGLDGAGVVDAVGPGVRHLSPGDAVMFCQGGLGGGLGSYEGTAVASVIVGLAWTTMEQFTLSAQIGSVWASITPMLVLALVLLIRPTGLFGEDR